MSINRKLVTLTLMSAVAFAAIIGGSLLTTHADATTPATYVNTNTPTVNSNGDFTLWNNDSIGFGGHGRGRGFGGGPGGFGYVEVSAEFEQTVTNIAKSDTDVQNLLADGYNVTQVRPIIKAVVGADGIVVMKATNATVTLQKNTTGRAIVWVNVEASKVTRIEILSRTVIEKP